MNDSNLQIHHLDAINAVRWDAFVDACPEATFFHRAGWAEVLHQAFGHKAHFLYAEADGAIQGILPLGHIRSLLFGNALISTPFCVLGGAVGDEAACAALEKAAIECAQSLRVDHLELRHAQPRHPDWPAKRELYVNFRKTIDPDPEVNMKAIPRKQRAMVRKGIEVGLQGEIDASVERLYLAYSESVRNLGTPVFSRRYFETLKSVFGPDCEVLTVTHQGQTVASVMSFYFRDEVLPYYGGGTTLARDLKGNDFMYWDLMRRACERGVRVFDYGRSKVGTGSYSFKKNWGFIPELLHYEFQLVKATKLPDVNPLNPKYRLFIDAWKQLPLPVSRWLGPFLARSLG
ncbi:MAG: FemAB family PEP-CTERM system-associated protein [Candidatus Competibacteraceae bacterium]|nr:FemAB family PEP-CTERM system-associated protein [Candidatus Competibacteraceae bacterium]MCP5124380.1 FemAB family PEP-CTERM system-associated protein [Gammaproteobacteria bacterium]HRX69994.1 FemAB family PEP-CTERM system-associated protein [Candidatus Competibacteraceae bacterium]